VTLVFAVFVVQNGAQMNQFLLNSRTKDIWRNRFDEDS